MKISELIGYLEAAKSRHGDRTVVVFGTDGDFLPHVMVRADHSGGACIISEMPNTEVDRGEKFGFPVTPIQANRQPTPVKTILYDEIH